LSSVKQLNLFKTERDTNGGFKDPGALDNKKLPMHRWVTWIAGFSAAFAKDAIEKYLPTPKSDSIILDPFAGVGTTLIESFKKSINTIGFEINPFAALVSQVKLESAVVEQRMLEKAIAGYACFMGPIERLIDQSICKGDSNEALQSAQRPKTQPPRNFRSRIPFFSSPVEQKVLFTFDYIGTLQDESIQRIFKMAFGAVMVSFSNYSYEPSLGSRPGAGRDLIENAAVSQIVTQKLKEILADIKEFQDEISMMEKLSKATVYRQSFFEALKRIESSSIDLIITSPPYLNNYHYVRNTRPHLFWLDFVSQPKDLQELEKENYGKFWQTVRELEATNLHFDLPVLQEVIEYVRNLNQAKGIYGGQGWANYIATYFNDTYSFMAILKKILKSKGIAVIVVGNSIIQGVEIKVEKFFSRIAALHEIETEGIYIVRQKRVGSSIVNTGVREKSKQKTELYDAAVVLKR